MFKSCIISGQLRLPLSSNIVIAYKLL